MTWLRVLAHFAGITKADVLMAVRNFILVFLPLFGTAALGWLNELTKWAPGRPFPDYHVLAAAVVTATAAGLVAAFTLLWRAAENKLGKGLLRRNPPKI